MSNSQKKSKGESFIEKLLRETIENPYSSDADQDPTNFDIYFEKKLTNVGSIKNSEVKDEISTKDPLATQNLETFLKSLNIPYYSGNYLSELKCFRFIFWEKTLDFPQNWSFFEKFHNGTISNEMEISFLLSPQNDRDDLLPTLSSLHIDLEQVLFLQKKDGFYLIPFDPNRQNENTSFLKMINQALRSPI